MSVTDPLLRRAGLHPKNVASVTFLPGNEVEFEVFSLNADGNKYLHLCGQPLDASNTPTGVGRWTQRHPSTEKPDPRCGGAWPFWCPNNGDIARTTLRMSLDG